MLTFWQEVYMWIKVGFVVLFIMPAVGFVVFVLISLVFGILGLIFGLDLKLDGSECYGSRNSPHC